MTDFAAELAGLTGEFSGVISACAGADVLFEQAYGLADRAHQLPCTVQTRFAIASGSKTFTALTIVSLVADGALSLSTTARSVLGSDLPLIADDVTLEQLLNHTSGIGDYADEDLDEPLPLKVPVYKLVDTEDYLPALDGFPSKFPAGSRFCYCNGGYVLLALIAERVSGHAFHELVHERVLRLAGMTHTEFLRSDELPGDAALGYLADGRTNVFALPVRGNGDGGSYTTLADIHRFWAALFAGQLVASEWVDRMTSPQSGGPPWDPMHYGYGFWLDGPAVELHGGDHGVRFRSAYDRTSSTCCTVIANVETPINPIVNRLRELTG